MRLKLLLVIGFLVLVTAGCDLGPVGTPPPLTRSQARAVADCQHAVKGGSSGFMAVKVAKLNDCGDKILALQLALENDLMTQAQFDKAIAKVRQDCLKGFDAVTRASTTLADLIFSNCTQVESLIFDSNYDPLKFIALGENNPIELGPIETVDDIVRYACLGSELMIDTAVWLNFPRSGGLFDSVGLASTNGDVIIPEIILDQRCGGAG